MVTDRPLNRPCSTATANSQMHRKCRPACLEACRATLSSSAPPNRPPRPAATRAHLCCLLFLSCLRCILHNGGRGCHVCAHVCAHGTCDIMLR